MRIISFRTSLKTKQEFEKLALAGGVSASEIVRESINSFLENDLENNQRPINTTAHIDHCQFAKLKEISNAKNISISKLVDNCLSAYLLSKNDSIQSGEGA